MSRNPLAILRPLAVLAAVLYWGAFTARAAEHPRVLVDKADVEKLRAKVKQEPYASMLKCLQAPLSAPADATSLMYDNRPLNLAALYLLTGDKKYATDAEAFVVKMVNDQDFWNKPGSKGLTRCAGALRAVLAFDVCSDAWSDADRKLVSGKLLYAADNIMKGMGAGANQQLANNWQAVRYGGAGIAALACDEAGGEEIAKQAYGKIKQHLNANLGDNGWNPEGIGYTQYPWQFTGPFCIAAQRAKIGDLRTDVKKAALTFWHTFVGTVAIPRPGGVGLRADLSDDHPTFGAGGTAGLAFWYAPEAQRPAIKWMYDYLCGARGDKTFDSDAGGGLYSILYYPAELEARNPAEGPGLNFVDASHGIAIFRNRFQDENDIVALVNGHARQPMGCHGGSDTNTLRLMGLGSCFIVGSGRTGDANGQSNLFPAAPAAKPPGGLGKLVNHEFGKDGSGLAVTSGSCMGTLNHQRVFAADYSGRAGAPGVFVDAETSDNGKVWRLNTPEFNTIATGQNTITLTSPTGSTLTIKVIEPAQAVFKEGTFERGGGAGHVGFPYRDKKWINNKWVEFACDKNVLVVMVLQEQGKASPAVTGTGTAAQASLKIGNLTAELSGAKVTFGP